MHFIGTFLFFGFFYNDFLLQIEKKKKGKKNFLKLWKIFFKKKLKNYKKFIFKKNTYFSRGDMFKNVNGNFTEA